MRMSRDGRTLVLQAPDNRIEVWDVRRARKIRTITASEGQDLSQATKGFFSFELSPDGRWMAATYHALTESSEEPPQLAVWDTRTGEPLIQGQTGTRDAELAFQDDGRRLLAVHRTSRTGRFLDLRTGAWSESRALPGLGTGRDSTVSFGGSTRRALVVPEKQENSRELWDLVAGRRLAKTGTGTIENMALPADNPEMVVGSRGKNVALYDAGLRRTRSLGAFTWDVLSLSASGDGRWVAAASADGAITLFDTAPGSGGTPVPHPDPLKDARFTPDGRLAYRSDQDSTQLWKVGEGNAGLTRLGRIPRPVDPDYGAVALSSDARQVALFDRGVVTFWDPLTGAALGGPVQNGDGEFSSTGGPRLFYVPGDSHVVGGWDDGVAVVDVRTGEVTQTVTEEGFMTGLGQSGDRRTLALVDQGVGGISVWRWSADESRFEHVRDSHAAGTASNQRGVAVSYGGEKVATVDSDSRVTILDVATGRTVTSAAGPGQGQPEVVFSNDARLALQPYGVGEGSGLDLWDTATGDALGQWSLAAQGVAGPELPVTVAQAPGGGILTLGRDGSLVRRSLGVAEWKATLCGLSSEPLAPEDKSRYLSELEVAAPCPAES